MDINHRNHLETLADFLEKVVDPKKFDMSSWMSISEEPQYWVPPPKVTEICHQESEVDTESLSCGSAGCALGWATTIPYFRQLGLRLIRNYSENYCSIVLIDEKTRETKAVNFDVPKILFGMHLMDINYIFSAEAYHGTNPTPRDVAARIREYLANPHRASPLESA